MLGLVVLLVGSAPAGAATTTGYWRFEEGAPDAPATGTGTANALGLDFDGAVGQVAFPSTFPLHLPGDATIELWMRYRGNSHQAVLWARTDDQDTDRFHLHVNGNGSLGREDRDPGGALHPIFDPSQASIAFDTWTHDSSAPRSSRRRST